MVSTNDFEEVLCIGSYVDASCIVSASGWYCSASGASPSYDGALLNFVIVG